MSFKKVIKPIWKMVWNKLSLQALIGTPGSLHWHFDGCNIYRRGGVVTLVWWTDGPCLRVSPRTFLSSLLSDMEPGSWRDNLLSPWLSINAAPGRTPCWYCCVHMYSRVTTPACWPDGATAHIIGHADPCNTGFWLVRSRSSLPLIGWWVHLSPLSQLAMCGAHDDIITLVTDNYHPLWLDYHNLPHEAKQMLHRISISEASERLAWRKHVLLLPILFNDCNPARINWWEYCCEAACHKMLSFPCMVSLYTPQSQ